MLTGEAFSCFPHLSWYVRPLPSQRYILSLELLFSIKVLVPYTSRNFSLSRRIPRLGKIAYFQIRKLPVSSP